MVCFDRITIRFVFDEPLDHYIGGAIHLKQKVDSLWKEAPFAFAPDSVELRRYNLFSNWEPGTEYELEIFMDWFFRYKL